jgi:hypothetical protein
LGFTPLAKGSSFKALKTRPPSHSHLLHNPLCIAPGPPRGGWELVCCQSLQVEYTGSFLVFNRACLLYMSHHLLIWFIVLLYHLRHNKIFSYVSTENHWAILNRKSTRVWVAKRKYTTDNIHRSHHVLRKHRSSGSKTLLSLQRL